MQRWWFSKWNGKQARVGTNLDLGSKVQESVKVRLAKDSARCLESLEKFDWAQTSLEGQNLLTVALNVYLKPIIPRVDSMDIGLCSNPGQRWKLELSSNILDLFNL